MIMHELIYQYGFIMVLYLFHIGLMQAVSVLLMGYKYIRPRNDRNGYYLTLLAVFTIHDVFWSVFGYSVEKNEIMLAIEILVMCLTTYFILKYLFVGDVTYNFLHIFAIEWVYQIFGMILTFPAYMIISEFDISKASEFMNAPTWFNYFYVLIVYLIIAIVAKVVWDFVYKHRRKSFKIVLIVFCILDIGALSLGGWRIMCAAFVAGVYIIVSAIIQNNQNEKYLREQFAYYKDLAEKQAQREKEISVIRHDIANHMNVMEEMQKNDEGQELLKKLDKANRSMTGIPVLDCLIREKTAVCEKEGISFEKEGGAVGETKITEYEFVSLFANLLDNAIEAAKETRDKKVKLSVEKQQGVLKVIVNNSKLAERKPLEDDFKTTKEDKKNHGIGSRIVRDIVEVHGGRVTYYDEGEQMRVVALMQI